MSRTTKEYEVPFKVRKRDNRIVDFDQERITSSIFKAAESVGGNDRERALAVSNEVVKRLIKKYPNDEEITSEEIFSEVKETLKDMGHGKTALALDLFVKLKSKVKNIKSLIDADELVRGYIEEQDWRVKENSNMAYSWQGLNNHISSSVQANYWLYSTYPKYISNAHINADIHIHDLGMLATYCCGWDLKDLLLKGFTGVPGKISSAPAKHFGVALGQCVNFLYTLQHEAAGAQAFSSFDTLLAPFIRYDKLSYKEVKQKMQEFLFNMNVPTRVGCQCVSQDTEILTPQGWKGYKDIKEGVIIKTFNLETNRIEDQTVTSIYKGIHKGVMYNLTNRIQDQLISPKHRVVRKIFNGKRYILEPIEEVNKLKSPIIIPIAGKNANTKVNISDEQIKLMAWIISEGSIEVDGKSKHSSRISIYQSEIKNSKKYKEIISLLNHFNLNYSISQKKGLGDFVKRIRLDAKSSKVIHKWFGTKESIKFVPHYLLEMDLRQSRIFLDTYIKGDGHENSKITTTDIPILNDLQIIAVNSEYGFTVLKRKPTLGSKELYILRLIRHNNTYINRIKKVQYDGVIWCPHTKNETIIAKRNGTVFITGNTPFTNITMDLTPHGMLAKENIIIGGVPQKEKYGDFQQEMDMLNRAFCEVMMEGDAQGRLFSYPIPTYNITKDFDWDSPKFKPLWEMTAKYGIPYFSNFINSDMSPDDARSMCPLAGDEKVLIKSSRGRGLEYSEIRNIYEGNSKQDEYEIYSDGKFVKGYFNKFEDQEMIQVTLSNNHKIKMSNKHLNLILENRDANTKELMGSELTEDMYLPYSLNTYDGKGGNSELGYFVGAFAGDGSFDKDSTVVFSLSLVQKNDVAERLIDISTRYFGASNSITEYKDTQLMTLKIFSKAAVGICKDFVLGKEREKCYSPRVYGTSKEFRLGVIAGHYATDGGNRNRIYTSSPKMIESLNMLSATLGTTTSIYEDDRENRLGKEPNYAVLVYKLGRKRYGDFWFKKDGMLWVKIKSIKKISNTTAYCFEVKDAIPLFTVGTTGILTHNCRLRLDNRELRKRGGGLFGANPLTGSIGVVTINMPRIGYLAKDKNDFYKRLDRLMDIAKESLSIKRKLIERYMDKGLYPYSKFYLKDVKERFGEYFKNHFNTIGILGLNEAMVNYYGTGNDITSKKGRKFALEIMDHMREKLMSYQLETNQLFNLEATPGESTTYRFAKADKKKFGDKIIAASDLGKMKHSEPYYTNSSQLPVGFTDDIFEALDLQDDFQCKYTGGTVLHVFLGEKMPSCDSVSTFVRKVAENYKLPYYSITPTFSVCPKHGYIPGEHIYCPKCDAESGYIDGTPFKEAI
jgi:ribonucleoside-triphosphate reductase